MREGIWAHIGVEESAPSVAITSPLGDYRFIAAVFGLVIGMAFVGSILYVINRRIKGEAVPGPGIRILAERKHFLTASALAAGLSVVMLIFVQRITYTPAQASYQALAIDELYDLQFKIAAVIFSTVLAFILYSVIVFRQRKGETEEGPAVHGNSKLETVWTIIPLAIVIFLGFYAAAVLSDIKKPIAEEPLEVEVTALRFAWIFKYPEHGVTSTELRLPVDRPVLLKMTSKDVVHSFWVPEFRLKMDTVPGLETQLWVTPSRIGEYQVLCAELCGVGHTFMVTKAVVVAEEDFDAWIKKRSGGLRSD